MDKQLFLHIHWPLPPELRDRPPEAGLEAALAESVGGLCRRHGADLLALTAGRRRLHLLLRLPTHLAVARWVLLLKGASSRRLSRERNLPVHGEKGYGLRSLSPSHVERARRALARLATPTDPGGAGRTPLKRPTGDAILVGS